ncbi:DgyrCDS6854 [Dimorphilus gyrociliatus]|uniref:WD repeat-containing protein 91 n=1 Tax=Dimorphilus gyrociliatus TaxID=2664684 RepID=A0A7I8VQV0_9ANNE|nr:DgyrCDS6854 [Dimorphilus gyrociliatus]
MADVAELEDLVKEYLVFRGLNNAAKAFDFDTKNDNRKGMKAEKVMEQLQQCITNSDINHLKEYWKFLNVKIFSTLDETYQKSLEKLETDLFRLYVISAVQSNKSEKVSEFFDKMTHDLVNRIEWKEWFGKLEDEFQKMQQLEAENKKLREKITDLTKRDEMSCGTKSIIDGLKDPYHAANLEIMDDFYVISQETSKQPRKEEGNKTSQTYKWFGKGPSLSSSPKSLPSKTPEPLTSRSLSTPVSKTAADEGTSLPKLAQNLEKKSSTKVSSEDSADTNSNSSATEQKDENNADYTCDGTDISSSTVQKLNSIKSLSTTTDCSSTLPGSLSETTTSDMSSIVILSHEFYKEHSSTINYCSFNQSGRLIASTDLDGIIKTWESQKSMSTKATIMSKKATLISHEWVKKAENLILLGNKSGKVKLFDIENKKSVSEMIIDETLSRIKSISCSPVSETFVCSAVEPGSKRNSHDTSTCREGKLCIMDLETTKLIREINEQKVAPSCITFNSDGRKFLAGFVNGDLGLYDMGSCECIKKWKAHNNPVNTVYISSSNVFSMDNTGTLCSWTNGSLENEYELKHLQGMEDRDQSNDNVGTGKSFAFNSKGNYLICSGINGGFIYELKSDKKLELSAQIGSNESTVTSVDWFSGSHDCTMCLTGSVDGVVRVITLLVD